MGNIFSCIRPKNARLKNAQHKRRKHKNSKMQKIFEDVDVRSCLEVDEIYWETTGERKVYDEGKWEVEDVEEEEEKKEKKVKDEAREKQDEKEKEKEMIHTQDYHIYQSTVLEPESGPDNNISQEVITNENYEMYLAEDQEPEPQPVKKIYHCNAENWKHFHAALEQEHREQYEDDLSFILEQYRSEVNEYAEEMLDIVLDKVEDVIGYREMMSGIEEDRWTPPLVEGEVYSGPGILKKHVNTNENHKRNITWGPDVKPPASDMNVLDPIVEAFMRERSRLVLQRTKEERHKIRVRRQMAKLSKLSCRQINNSSCGMITEGCRIPVPVKRTNASMTAPGQVKRTWTTPSRIPVPVTCKGTNASVTAPSQAKGPWTTPSRIPVPVTCKITNASMTAPSQAKGTWTTPSHIPVPVMKKTTEIPEPKTVIKENMKRAHASVSAKTTVTQIEADAKREINKGPDRGIIWPNGIEELYSVSTKAYYVEQFQRTELFRQRYRKKMDGHALWEKGLTPFQIWVLRYTGTAVMDRILHPTPKPHPYTAKARVSCWRRPNPIHRRKP